MSSDKPLFRKFDDDVNHLEGEVETLASKFEELDGKIPHQEINEMVIEKDDFIRPNNEKTSLFKLRYSEVEEKLIDELKSPLEELLKEMEIFLQMGPSKLQVDASPYFKQQVILHYGPVLLNEDLLKELSQKFWFWDRKFNTLTDFRLLKTPAKTITLIIALAKVYDQ